MNVKGRGKSLVVSLFAIFTCVCSEVGYIKIGHDQSNGVSTAEFQPVIDPANNGAIYSNGSLTLSRYSFMSKESIFYYQQEFFYTSCQNW